MAEENNETAEIKDRTVECVWSNVWTSKGKLLKGETAEVPADEAEALKSQGSVKVKRAA